MRQTKSIKDSKTKQVHLLRYEDINGAGRLFGGKLVAWIDEVAVITARRHSEMKVTTVAIDHLQFINPVFLDQLVIIVGCVTYVGNTTIEVRVDTFLEELCGKKSKVNRAYVSIVALDANNRPSPVPFDIMPESDEEKTEWEDALERVELRKQRRLEGL
ncbi:MAG: acyl-CoA thioesterase [Lachnospiraceae bacterium]|nr:acyl-CoA thioesterase [Lachnospiraceae bacterium]